MDIKKMLKPGKEEWLSESIRSFKDKPFREYFEFLDEHKKLDWFLDTTVGDLIKLKDLKVVPKEEIDDAELYELKVLKVLNDVELGESKRGIGSSEILEKIGGNAPGLRKVLEKLKNEKKVHSTGKTQGMKWVLFKFADKAEENYRK